MKKTVIMLCLFFIFYISLGNVNLVKSDDVNDIVTEELKEIDLSEIEDLFDGSEKLYNFSFGDLLNKAVSGDYSLDYESFFSYLLGVILGRVKAYVPVFLFLTVIALLLSLLKEYSGERTKDSTYYTVNTVAIISAFTVLLPILYSIFNKTKITIENMAKMSEIMSPIITALMVSSGGNVTATVYKPSVVFLSNIVINVFLKFVMPIVLLTLVFCFLSTLSNKVNLNKFSEFFFSVMKWVIGLLTVIFGIFTSVCGMGAVGYDGVTFKATKYALSSSVPIVGGIVNGGFDLIVASSFLIKNAIGIAGVFFILLTVLIPVLEIAIFSLTLKLSSSVIKTFSDGFIPELCVSVSKAISYLTASLIVVGIMFFVLIVLTVFSVGTFV